MKEKSTDFEKAYSRSLKRIAQRDVSSFEMRSYLEERFDLEKEQLDEIIERLEKARLIDDERFLNSRIETLQLQQRGNQRIIQDLIPRGYKKEEIEAVLNQEPHDVYVNRAYMRLEAMSKRAQKGSKFQRIEKLKAHMARQGFEFYIIEEAFERLDLDHDKDLEYEALKKIMTRYHQRYHEKYAAYEYKQKMIQVGLSRGYQYDMIERILKELENEN
ncbi:MAG TPA: RecX family transcriptional regulator [Erysipelothrix sp.]